MQFYQPWFNLITYSTNQMLSGDHNVFYKTCNIEIIIKDENKLYHCKENKCIAF